MIFWKNFDRFLDQYRTCPNYSTFDSVLNFGHFNEILLPMKIKYSALVSDARGKLNGSVASKNRFSQYLRNKVTGVNPQTAAQMAVRANLATLAQAWRGLTVAQRAAWNAAVGDFARNNIFGDSVKPSGFGLYVQLNRNLQAAGQSTISSPPALTAVQATIPSSIVFTTSGSTVTVAFAPDPVPANHAVIVMATPPLSPGVGFVKSEYRQLEVMAATDSSLVDITSSYTAEFGAVPAEGQKIFVAMRSIEINTGIASPRASIGAIANYV